MSIRRDLLLELGGFRHGIGRVGATPVGCEETELCIRAQHQRPGGTVLYMPDARVLHRVVPERTTVRYFFARCRAEGMSKALVSRLAGSRDGLRSERSYVTTTLPAGMVRSALSMKPWGLARSMVIAAGLSVTAIGYLYGLPAARRMAR
jgi:hypothetical protein